MLFRETITVYVGYEVLTAVVMKTSVFWDIILCSPLMFNGQKEQEM
jgi:hypothetical protein